MSLPKTVREDLGLTDEAVGDAFILSNSPVVPTEEEPKHKQDEDG